VVISILVPVIVARLAFIGVAVILISDYIFQRHFRREIYTLFRWVSSG